MVKKYPNQTNRNDKDSNKLLDDANNADEKPPPLYIFSKVLGKYVLAHKEEQLIKEKKDKDELWDSLFSKLLEDAVKQVNELLAYHQEQITIYFKAIEEHITLLQLLADQKVILEQEKKDFEEDGRFELNEAGQLKNQEAEQLLQKWEAETGTTIDRNSPETYYTILQMLNDIEEQQEATYQQLEEDEAAYEYHKEQRDRAEELIEQLENGTVGQQKEAVNQIQQLSIHQKRHLQANAEMTTENPRLSTETIFTEEDFEQSNFDFGFTPLKESFNASTQEAEQKLEVEEIETVILPQNSIKSPSI